MHRRGHRDQGGPLLPAALGTHHECGGVGEPELPPIQERQRPNKHLRESGNSPVTCGLSIIYTSRQTPSGCPPPTLETKEPPGQTQGSAAGQEALKWGGCEPKEEGNWYWDREGARG